MSSLIEKEKIILSNQKISPEELFETNDLKLASALVASGHGLIMVRHVLSPRGKVSKPEILFGYRMNQEQHDVQIAFLSGTLHTNALSLLEARDRLISYIANGHRSILNPITEEVVNKSNEKG